MINRKKPVFRLTLVFISVVIVSGSILAYFSINNISNLKELTEKKVLEEQVNLAQIISSVFLEEINKTASRFPRAFEDNISDQISAIKLIDTNALISNSFVVGRDGTFLWPWFADHLGQYTESLPSESFQRIYDLAEKAEFVKKNLKGASRYYHAALQESVSSFDSVRSLNALARLAVKMGNRTEALTNYSTIITRYYTTLDGHGFPYVYYAIPQMIKVSGSADTQMAFHMIISCLTRIDAGDIPLNHSTHNILSQIQHWIEKQAIIPEEEAEANQLIQHINSRLAFIERNAGVIREHLGVEERTENPLIGGIYTSLTGSSQDLTELILINLKADYPAGFTILLDQYWSKVSGKGIFENTKFAYEVELIKKVNGNSSSENPLATYADISSYFPGHQVLIRLKNEGLIDHFVRRRSWINGIALVLLLGGMILGVLLILRDISREDHLARLRSDFISNVTHELKTPLTSVQLFTESIILDRINSEADKKEYLRIILKETESLKRMINNILEFSKKEKGKLEYKFEKVNVTSLVNQAIDDLDYWLVEKKFSMFTRIEDNVIVYADPDAFRQAIINLMSNAIKFSRDRKEITVGLKKDNESVMLVVEDKGIGIPEDKKELIFEAFYRVGQEEAEDISGTGLGLTVVKEIVEAHNGKILVESRLNEGSKFTIILNSNQEND